MFPTRSRCHTGYEVLEIIKESLPLAGAKTGLLGIQGCRLVAIITTALLRPITSRPANGHAGYKTRYVEKKKKEKTSLAATRPQAH